MAATAVADAVAADDGEVMSSQEDGGLQPVTKGRARAKSNGKGKAKPAEAADVVVPPADANDGGADGDSRCELAGGEELKVLQLRCFLCLFEVAPGEKYMHKAVGFVGRLFLHGLLMQGPLLGGRTTSARATLGRSPSVQITIGQSTSGRNVPVQVTSERTTSGRTTSARTTSARTTFGRTTSVRTTSARTTFGGLLLCGLLLGGLFL